MTIENVYKVFGIAGTWILITFGFLCGLASIIINIIGNKKENKMNPNKINRAVYRVRLAHNLKKSSMAELQLTLACVTAEINRRQKGAK